VVTTPDDLPAGGLLDFLYLFGVRWLSAFAKDAVFLAYDRQFIL